MPLGQSSLELGSYQQILIKEAIFEASSPAALFGYPDQIWARQVFKQSQIKGAHIQRL